MGGSFLKSDEGGIKIPDLDPKLKCLLEAELDVQKH